MALLTENGPCSVNEDGKSTTVNPYSWTEAAHVLWLDQPAGVGFSYGTEDDSNEKMVGEDAYYFLQAFFQTFPEYASAPLYIVGESYGGHYAPAIAHRVWMGNKNLKPDTIKLNLSGLGVGNGLTDPEEQYKWYPEMGHDNSHGIKIFDDSVYEGMKEAVPRCTALIHQCNQGDGAIDDFACQGAFVLCNTALTSPYQATGLNPYDIRVCFQLYLFSGFCFLMALVLIFSFYFSDQMCETSTCKCLHRRHGCLLPTSSTDAFICCRPYQCYDFSNVKKWLNLQSTKEALGVDTQHSHAWNSCNFGINAKVSPFDRQGLSRRLYIPLLT